MDTFGKFEVFVQLKMFGDESQATAVYKSAKIVMNLIYQL